MRPTPEFRTDPWTVTAPAPAGAPSSAATGGDILPRAVGAWALASLMLVQVWIYGGRTWGPVLAGALVALTAEAVIRWRTHVPAWVLPLRVAGLAALAAASLRVIGGTPTVFLFGALVVADAALVSWRPMLRWPPRHQATASLAIGVLVTIEVAWARGAPRVVVALGLAAAVLVVELYARAPGALARADAAVRRATRAVATAIVRVVLFVVASAVLYLPGLIVRVLRAPFSARRAGRSNWQRVETSVVDGRHDAKRPFVSTEPRVRAARTLRGLVLVTAVALLAFALARRTDDSLPGPDVPVALQPGATTGPTSAPGGRQVFATELAIRYSSLPAYRGSSFADALQAEEAKHVVNGELRGRYVNIRGGRRTTIDPPSCRCDHVSLWLSGGSAAFGTGQRDAHTIASDLVRIAAREDHIALDVTNVSHDGYTFQMETQWEITQSLRTEDPPDLLVFYNGWNDAMAELAADYLDGPDAKRELSSIIPAELQAINDDSDRFLASTIGPAAGRAAATRYLAIQQEANRLARAAGVQTAYFLQADALGSRAQLAPYEAIDGIPTEQLMDGPLGQTLDAMAEALGSHVVNLRGLFGDTDPPVFLGLVHQNEAGAEAVAERIYRELRPRILELAR